MSLCFPWYCPNNGLKWHNYIAGYCAVRQDMFAIYCVHTQLQAVILFICLAILPKSQLSAMVHVHRYTILQRPYLSQAVGKNSIADLMQRMADCVNHINGLLSWRLTLLMQIWPLFWHQRGGSLTWLKKSPFAYQTRTVADPYRIQSILPQHTEKSQRSNHSA